MVSAENMFFSVVSKIHQRQDGYVAFCTEVPEKESFIGQNGKYIFMGGCQQRSRNGPRLQGRSGILDIKEIVEVK